MGPRRGSPDCRGLRKQRGHAGNRIPGDSRGVPAAGAVGGRGLADPAQWRRGAGHRHRSEHAAHGRLRADPPGSRGPDLRWPGRRSSWSAPIPIPRHAGADRPARSGRIFPQTIFSGAGAPETGAASRWHHHYRRELLPGSRLLFCAAVPRSRKRRRDGPHPGTAGPPGAGEPRPHRTGAATHRASRMARPRVPTPAAPAETPPKLTVEDRLEIAEHRIEEQAQTKVEAVAEVPHPPDRHGAVQRLHQLQAERRRRLPGGRLGPRPRPRRRHRPANHHRPGIPRSRYRLGRPACTAPSTWISSPATTNSHSACAPPPFRSIGRPARSPPAWRSPSSIRANPVRWRRSAFRR